MQNQERGRLRDRRAAVPWADLPARSVTTVGPRRPSLLQPSPPIFTPEKHNHSSCVVETENGRPAGGLVRARVERKSDDVSIQAAWLPKGADEWSPRFVTADTPGYPDCNPAVFADPDGKIWLFWPTILDHRWEGTAQVRRGRPAANPRRADRLVASGVLHLTPESARSPRRSTRRSTRSRPRRRRNTTMSWSPSRAGPKTCSTSGSAGCPASTRSFSLRGAGSCRCIPTRSRRRSWRSATTRGRPGRPATR